jgi:hypothetical protein
MRDRGIQFDWAVSQATKTRPSVPVLMTSLYPTATGRAGRFLPAVIPFVNTRVYRFRDDPTERSALLPALPDLYLRWLAQDLFSQLQEANMITQRRLTAGENVDLQFDPDTVIRSQHPVVGNCRHVAADNGAIWASFTDVLSTARLSFGYGSGRRVRKQAGAGRDAPRGEVGAALGRRAAAHEVHHQRHDQENEEDEEQDLRYPGGGLGDPAEPEQSCDDGNHQEHECPVQHRTPPSWPSGHPGSLTVCKP